MALATTAKNPMKQKKGKMTENPLKPKAPRHKIKSSYASENPMKKGKK